MDVTPSRLKINQYNKYKKQIFKCSILYKESTFQKDYVKCAEMKLYKHGSILRLNGQSLHRQRGNFSGTGGHAGLIKFIQTLQRQDSAVHSGQIRSP